MQVLCICDNWVCSKNNTTPKKHQVYEVLKTHKHITSGKEYYILKGFPLYEYWNVGAFTPIYTPNERTTKDIEAPRAASGPVRETEPFNC